MIKTLKKYPIQIAILSFVVALGLELWFHNSQTLSFLIATGSSIFMALKYKLDQANYNKSLFEERYLIFEKLDATLRSWAGNNKVTSEMNDGLNSILRRSYYLFSSETYEFIKEFRESMLILFYFNTSVQTETMKEDSKKANNFLSSLVDKENFPSKFGELKIDSY
jgi:hypothetical protein